MGLFEKIGAGLKKTRTKLMDSVNGMLSSFKRIDDELFEELEEILIMSDCGAATAGRLCDDLKNRVKEQKITEC